MNQKILLVLALLILGSLGAANILASSKFTNSGQELKALEQEKQELVRQNQHLQEYILDNTSLQRIQKVAQEQGFVEPGELLTLEDTSAPVALSN